MRLYPGCYPGLGASALSRCAACGFLVAARGFCPFRTCGGKVALVAQMVLV